MRVSRRTALLGTMTGFTTLASLLAAPQARAGVQEAGKRLCRVADLPNFSNVVPIGQIEELVEG